MMGMITITSPEIEGCTRTNCQHTHDALRGHSHNRSIHKASAILVILRYQDKIYRLVPCAVS